MSPRNDSIRASAAVLALALGAGAAAAQTIGDYSRAQRLLLESAMTQAAARSAGASASTSVAAAPVAPSSPASLPSPAPRVAPAALPSLASGVQVSGVIASGASAVAEVVVNATAYLLQAGQVVPGTSWHVESVAVERVVLSRRTGAAATDGEGGRKVFALPPVR